MSLKHPVSRSSMLAKITSYNSLSLSPLLLNEQLSNFSLTGLLAITWRLFAGGFRQHRILCHNLTIIVTLVNVDTISIMAKLNKQRNKQRLELKYHRLQKIFTRKFYTQLHFNTKKFSNYGVFSVA